MPDQATNPPAPENGAPANQPTNETFEAWLEKAEPTVKALYEQHTEGLRNTVRATRDERDNLAKQIKELLPKAEKGSELEKTLIDFSEKLEK
jgi:hypothetical protein